MLYLIIVYKNTNFKTANFERDRFVKLFLPTSSGIDHNEEGYL